MILGQSVNGSEISVIGNQSLTDFQEDKIKHDFFDLIQKKIELPPFNGSPYNTRMLAYDLMKYDIVSNRLSRRDSISRFIPDGMNKSLGINEMLRRVNITSSKTRGVKAQFEKDYRRFADQYMVQSEGIRTTINAKDVKSESGNTIYLEDENNNKPKYVKYKTDNNSLGVYRKVSNTH